MANPEHLAKIHQGVDAWNEWRTKNREIHPDLSIADLRGMNLVWANLQFANLGEANLMEARLEKANFSRAHLFRANLSGATLKGANLFCANLQESILAKANLHGADFFGVDLQEANLHGADFSGVILMETLFINVDLSPVKNLETCKHIGPSPLDFRTLTMSGPLPLQFLLGCGLSDKVIEYIPSLFQNDAIQFYSCFISYSHADKSFARRLFDALQGQGIRCWLDEHQLLPGDDIYEKVREGIRLWDKVLLCASKTSLTSWWVDNEIESAFKKEQTLMQDRKKKVLALIPLDLDGYIYSDQWESGKKDQVQSRLIANFRDWETNNTIFEAELGKVIKALRADDGTRENPPKSKL